MEDIIVVSSNTVNKNTIAKALPSDSRMLAVDSIVEAATLCNKKAPLLVIIDMETYRGKERKSIKLVKSVSNISANQILIVNGTQDSGVKLLCLDEDIVDYIEEPLITEILKKRIELQVITVRQRNQLMMQTNILESQRDELRKYNLSLKTVIESKSKEVQELQMAILATIASLVESRDDVTGGHLERTKKGLEILLTAAYDDKILGPQIKDWDFRLCLQSSQMHDVGKISIDDSILKKPGSLDKDEFTSMQHHTVYGAQIIDKIKMNAIDNTFLEYAKIFAESHHEKWNGTGYPYGLYGEAIPLKGRLLAVVDVYDALVSARPYKEPFSHEEAVRMIESGSGTHFDPDVNRVFMAVQDKYKAIEFTKEEILTRKDTLR